MIWSTVWRLMVAGCVVVSVASAPQAGTGGAQGANQPTNPPANPAANPAANPPTKQAETQQAPAHLRLGNFSISLAVKDVVVSRAFYEKLGFRANFGNAAKGWLIMQNESSTIGLFAHAFDKNILTWNPGWDRDCKTLPDFDDVRDIQKSLKAAGLTLTTSADEASTGPASLTLTDPDGNMILIDQHVPKPAK